MRELVRESGLLLQRQRLLLFRISHIAFNVLETTTAGRCTENVGIGLSELTNSAGTTNSVSIIISLSATIRARTKPKKV